MTLPLRGRSCRAFRLSALVFTALTPIVAVPHAAVAQTAAEKTYALDIPVQSLARSVTSLSTATGLQVVYAEDAPLSVQAPAVKGRMTITQALDRLTAGTGYTYRFTAPGVVTLVKAPEGNGEGERVTSAVRVEGTQGSPYFGGAGQAAGVNGTNGSRDMTATEGTKSFTSGALTIGSKAPQAMKDVPQSVSVLTSERMHQQNVTDFATALKQLPGITVTNNNNNLGTNLSSRYFSRGFEVNTFQIDGGAPLNIVSQIDMSVYDHVEVLRGAAGLFNGYGAPSATISLVLKKPLDHPQYVLDAQAGSWSNYRISADATAPIAFDGKLRARLVTTYQDNHYFYNIAKDNKIILYGIAELDVTPTTTVSGAINFTRQNSVPWYGGLPRYWTGEDLKLPRSTSLAFPWSRQNFDTTQLIGTIEQKIGDEWKLKVNVTSIRQTSTQKVGTVINAVDPNTKTGPAMWGYYNDYSSKQFGAEATLTGAIELFGQRQEITIGANHSNLNSGGYGGYTDLLRSRPSSPYQPYPNGPRYCYDFFGGCPAGTIGPATPPVDVFHFNPYALIYNEPPNPLPDYRNLVSGTIQDGAYMNLRLTAFDRLHLQTGIRWSRYQNNLIQESLCRFPEDCPGKQIGDPYDRYESHYHDTDFSWPPPVSLSFDVTKQLTAYAGYTDIYQSQARSLTKDRTPIGPVTGANYEAGLKWAARDGKLNISLAAYRIRQNGFATTDRSTPFVQVDPEHTCCYIADPNNTAQSQGFDLEATGEVLPGWQVSLSYTYSENSREGSTNGTSEGKPFLSIQPKNLYKVWMSYDFGAAGKTGMLSGLTVSGGFNGQTSGYFEGSGCKPAFIITDNFSGAPTCATGGTYNFNYTAPGWTIFSGRLDYRLSNKWSFAVNVENILDKTYYSGIGGDVYGGDWYGNPRNVTVSLRSKW